MEPLMSVLRQRFSQPIPPRRGAVQSHIIGPFKGMRTDVPPQNLRPGETPYSENLVLDDGILTPRPALVQFSSQTRPEDGGNTVYEYATGYSVNGTKWHLVLSLYTKSAIISSGTNSAWTLIESNLSLVQDTGSNLSVAQWATFYDADAKENAVVFANALTSPYYRVFDATSAWTSLAGFESVESTADAVESFDERLIFANTNNAAEGTVSNRVRWSVRGDPTDFTSIGAGFEDLLSMSGPILALVKEEDRLLIFSRDQIWVARPRRDAYAFDFDLLSARPGTIFRHTIQKTPAGVFWMDNSYNLYRIVGNEVRMISPDVREYIREQCKDQDTEKQQPWGQYNSLENTYMLFFKTPGTARTYAFFINVKDLRVDPDDPSKDKADWMLQDFQNSRIYNGFSAIGTTEHGRYGHDNIFPSISWAANSYNPLVKLDRDQFYDTASTELTFLWTSHAIQSSRDPTQFNAVSDVLLDYSYTTSTAITLPINVASKTAYSTTGFNDTSVTTVTLQNTDWYRTPAYYSPGNSSTLTNVPQVRSARVPLTPVAGRYPQILVYNPGTNSNKPQARLRIHNLHMTTRPWSGRRPY